MSHRFHPVPALLVAAALVAGLAGCGSGATVEGTVTPAPEVTASTPTAPSSAAAGGEQPVPVTSSITPPPPPSSPPSGTPVPPGLPAPAPGATAPAPAPVPASPGQPGAAGDFVGVLAGRDAVPPPGKDPVALAQQACGQFDQGRTMQDVSAWLGGETGFDPDRQGFFLGAGVLTYCPQNSGRLG